MKDGLSNKRLSELEDLFRPEEQDYFDTLEDERNYTSYCDKTPEPPRNLEIVDEEVNQTELHEFIDYLNNRDIIMNDEFKDLITESMKQPLEMFIPSTALTTFEYDLKKKMNEGWNIHIECKGIGRNYGGTFEGTAYNLHWDDIEMCYPNHAVAESIGELIEKLCIERDIDQEKSED
ncbi:hypothetical protein D3C81_1065450 [compost metagenome]